MKFEIVKSKYKKNKKSKIKLPERQTSKSIGYDFFIPINLGIRIPPKQSVMIWTDVKVKLDEDELLMIVPRSSTGIKKTIMLANTIGIIDPDYYGNKDNDGNIGICLYNYGNHYTFLDEGERFAQGIVLKSYHEKDKNKPERKGGFGSTGDKL